MSILCLQICFIIYIFVTRSIKKVTFLYVYITIFKHTYFIAFVNICLKVTRKKNPLQKQKKTFFD